MNHRIIRVLVITAITAQVLALCAMAGKYEQIYQAGEIVILRTAPVDPRDIFRGDYVQLQYNISKPSTAILTDFLKSNPVFLKNFNHKKSYQPITQKVYVSLKQHDNQAAKIRGLSIIKPEAGPFIKAKLTLKNWGNGDLIGQLNFGIEKYFVEQGTGLTMENQRGRGNKWQTAMEVEVAIGKDGTAIIKGHRWSRLSTRLQVTRPEQSSTQNNQTVAPIVTLGLKNNSDDTIQIHSSDEHCEWTLQNTRPIKYNQNRQTLTGGKTLAFTGRDCFDNGFPSQIISLRKDQEHTITIDLANPKWFTENQPSSDLAARDNSRNNSVEKIPISELPNRQDGFRFIYQDNKGRQYRTARFWPSGRID